MLKSSGLRESLVSVVIPAYNCERWISESIDSVINQSYNNIELIIVNDGSVDNTANILKEYINQENVHVFNISNSGPATARNFGVSKSRGDIIAFLDADDKWEENKIEKQLKYFYDNNCSLLLTNIKLIDAYNKVIGYQEKQIPLEKREQTIQFFRGKINQNTPTIMVKKSVFNEFGGFNINLKHREDHYFLMQVANKYGVNLLQEFLVLRRVWDNSMSNDYKKYKENPEEIIEHFKETRFPFFSISLQTFPYLEEYFKKEVGKYYNTLAHKLLIFDYIKYSRRLLRKAIQYDKNVKYILKLLILYIPRFLRGLFVKIYYKG